LSSYKSKLHKGTLEKFIVKTIADIKDIDSAQLIELKKMNYDPIEEYLKKGAEIDLVINYNGDIIGYNCIQFRHYTPSWGIYYLGHDEAWIGPAFVKRSYRNMGIHSEITRYGLERLKNRGFKRVVTSVNSRNTPSIKTFTRIGFNRIATIKVRRFFGKTFSKKTIWEYE